MARTKAVLGTGARLSREPFPPQRPIRYKRWFRQLLEISAKRSATQTIGKQNKRMLKRRSSPYASHDRKAVRHAPMDCTAVMLKPLPLSVRKR